MSSFDEELYLSAALRELIENYAAGDGGDGSWYAVVVRNNKTPVGFIGETSPTPVQAQRAFIVDVSLALDQRVARDGAWVVFFTHPRPQVIIGLGDVGYDRWHMAWLDKDGDAQFNVTCEDRFEETVKASIDKWVEDAHEAYERYQEAMRWLDLKPEQQFMAARGEKRPRKTLH